MMRYRLNGLGRAAADLVVVNETGATVVGPRAGGTLAELTLAVRKQLSTPDIAGTIHPYRPTGTGRGMPPSTMFASGWHPPSPGE